MNIRTAIDANGNEVQFGLASDADGNQQWVQLSSDTTDKEDYQQIGEGHSELDAVNVFGNPTQSQYASITPMAKIANAYQNLEDKQFKKTFTADEIANYNEYKNGSFLDNLVDAGKDEFGALWSGLQIIGSEIAGSDEDVTERLGEEAVRARESRIQQMAAKDSGFSGIMSDFGGRMAPYMLTGAVTRPVGKVALDMLKVPGKGFKNAVDTGLLGTKRMLDQQKKIPTKTKQGNEFRKHLPADLTGAAIVGAGEGYVHPEMTAGQGALSSLVGMAPAVLGRSTQLQAHPGKADPYKLDLIDWFESYGGKAKTGRKTGDTDLMEKEYSVGSDSRYRSISEQFDAHNEAVSLGILQDSMGIKRIDQDGTVRISPDQLNKHESALGKEFDRLTEGTRGQFSREETIALRNEMDKVESLSGATAKRNIDELARNLFGLNRVARNNPATGRFMPATFSGSSYQELRSKAKTLSRKFAAAENGQQAKKSVDLFIKTLDDAIERSVVNRAGDVDAPRVTSAQWKDINERWAMTQLVKENALTPNGRLDINKLTNHLNSQDLDRMLKNSGESGRIGEIHKLSKLHESSKNDPGGSLTASMLEKKGSDDKTTYGVFDGPKNQVPPIRGALLRHNMNTGYPGRSGYLNLLSALGPIKGPSGKNFELHPDNKILNLNQISRAGQQGTQAYYELADKLNPWSLDDQDEDSFEWMRKLGLEVPAYNWNN